MNDHELFNRQRRTVMGAVLAALGAPSLLAACGGEGSDSSATPAVLVQKRVVSRPTAGYTVIAAYFGGWKTPAESATPWYPPDIWGAYGVSYAGTFTVGSDHATLAVTLTSGSILQPNANYPAPGCAVVFSVANGSLPAPLVTGKQYYALAKSAATVQIFNNYADAVGNQVAPIALSGGTGTLTIATHLYNAGGAFTGWFMGAHPDRVPVHGAIDESMQSVMDQEIIQASQAGVDVFAINWYRDDFLTYATTNYMASPNKALMKWFIQWSNNSNVSSDPLIPTNSQQYFFEGIRRAATHMSDAAYYTVNALPVLAIFDETQIINIVKAVNGSDTPAGRLAFLQSCQKIVANVRGGDPTGGISGTVNNCTVSGTYRHAMNLMICSGDIGGWGGLEPVDGMYLYNVRSGTFDNNVHRAPHSFDEQMTAIDQITKVDLPAIAASYPDKTGWPSLMAGWNKAPWGGSSDTLADYAPPTSAQFLQHCNQVKAYLDTYPQTNRTLFLYAWNEYGEGGYVAPTVGSGTDRLTTLLNVFG